MTLRSKIMVVFNVPSSCQLLLYSYSKGGSLCTTRQNLSMSLPFLQHRMSSKILQGWRMLPRAAQVTLCPAWKWSCKEHPFVFVQQPLLSFSRQGHAGCQVQVSAPGCMTEPFHLQCHNTSGAAVIPAMLLLKLLQEKFLNR